MSSFCVKVIFSEIIRLELWNLGHAYILNSKVNPTFNFESWPTFYGSLTSQLFVKFLYVTYLTVFLRNCKS